MSEPYWPLQFYLWFRIMCNKDVVGWLLEQLWKKEMLSFLRRSVSVNNLSVCRRSSSKYWETGSCFVVPGCVCTNNCYALFFKSKFHSDSWVCFTHFNILLFHRSVTQYLLHLKDVLYRKFFAHLFGKITHTHLHTHRQPHTHNRSDTQTLKHAHAS